MVCSTCGGREARAWRERWIQEYHGSGQRTLRPRVDVVSTETTAVGGVASPLSCCAVIVLEEKSRLDDQFIYHSQGHTGVYAPLLPFTTSTTVAVSPTMRLPIVLILTVLSPG